MRTATSSKKTKINHFCNSSGRLALFTFRRTSPCIGLLIEKLSRKGKIKEEAEEESIEQAEAFSERVYAAIIRKNGFLG